MEIHPCPRRYAAAATALDNDDIKKQNVEPNHCPGRYSANDVDDNYYVKRNDTDSDHETCQPACSGTIDNLKVGFLYEIDHERLPPMYRIQLKASRVVMLAAISELNALLRYPSTHALKAYFVSLESREAPAKRYPDLDEELVMGAEIAKDVLLRQILPPEFHEQGHLWRFWLLPPRVTEKSASEINKNSTGERLVIGEGDSCLNCDGLLNWGVRRRITFKLKTPRVPSVPNLIKEGDTDVTIKINDEAAESVNRKRTRASLRQKTNSKSAKRICYQEKKQITKISKQKIKLSYDRWSQERYKTAEVKMLEIMKEKGAVIGQPILRPTLRQEARKHIGDTGLLDHLLKHMAGKVAPNGEDRFRRRHNADGAMEYWLESAKLIDIRKEAGVDDSYWIPPPGWKPGDSLSQDPYCARELTLLKEKMASELPLLKEKMAIMERDMQELLIWKREQPTVDKAIVPFVKPSADQNTVVSTHEDSESEMKVDYVSLLKRKTEMQQQLIQISNSIKAMEEEMRVKSAEGANSKAQSMEAIGENDKKESNEEEKKTDKEEKNKRQRSGFRVCRPQGTFLWPNMGGSCSSVANSGRALSPAQDGTTTPTSESLAMVPPPPWVTSTTTSHPILLPSPPPPSPATSHSTSPVKPLPVKRPTAFNPNAPLHFLKDHQKSGFYGTPRPSSCSTYPPASTSLMAPSTMVAGAEARNTKTTQRTYRRKVAMQHQNQRQVESVEAYCGPTWLALAPPSTLT